MCELESFKSWKMGCRYFVVLKLKNCPRKQKGGGDGFTLKEAVWTAFFDTGLNSFLDYSWLNRVDFSGTESDGTGRKIAKAILSFANGEVLATI